MPVSETAPISIKTAAGSGRSIDTDGRIDITSGSLVTLSTGDVVTDGNTIDGETPHGMLEFLGYAHSSMSAWPTISLPSGDAGKAFPGGAGTEIQYWGFESYQNANVSEIDAWCDAWFERDDSNNRIKVRLKSGTSAAMATDYWGYITYTGMSSPTFWVKHNYDGTVTNVSNEWSGYDYPDESPNITKDTYRQISSNGSNGGKQFFWVAKRITYSNMARARVVNDDVTFTVKIVSGGVDYTASMPAKNVVLEAKKGEEL